jgi:predicted GIY-YIG superfamily endonuclease
MLIFPLPLRMSQMLLFPDPRPLVERLGADFFRQAPICPGIYVMRDAADAPLYVGKARNLRKRLCSYRVANPQRMARRHLRLLRAVARIELIECADEASASAKEIELLRAWKPKFNRAGVWPSKEQFVHWRVAGERLELALADSRLDGWQSHVVLGGGAGFFLASLARLLRCAARPKSSAAQFPAGSFRGQIAHVITIHCGPEIESVCDALSELFSGEAEKFCLWAQNRMDGNIHCVYAAILESDFDVVARYNFQQAAQ